MNEILPRILHSGVRFSDEQKAEIKAYVEGKEMRKNEEMALVLFQAWAKYEGDKNADEIEWDDIGEWQQQGYLDQVNAIFKYLFEHGLLSVSLDREQMEAYGAKYGVYLAEKNEVNQ